MDAAVKPKATSTPGDPGLSQLRLGATDAVNVVNPYDPQGNLRERTGPRYLAGLLAKFGYHLPLAAAADNAARRVDRHAAPLPIQETRALVREVCHDFLSNAQEQPPQFGQMRPGSAY